MNLQSNDFELFGLPVRFALNRSDLDQRWKQLQREAHPDKFAAQGASAQRVAMQWSVRINEAYQRLKTPLKRAAYLCELNAQAIQAETNTAMPADFLMQQMEWREALEDASAAKDTAGLDSLFDEMQVEANRLTSVLTDLIDHKKDYPAASETTRKLVFIDKVCADIQQAIERLD